MKIRTALLALALSAVAGTAFAQASPADNPSKGDQAIAPQSTTANNQPAAPAAAAPMEMHHHMHHHARHHRHHHRHHHHHGHHHAHHHAMKKDTAAPAASAASPAGSTP